MKTLVVAGILLGTLGCLDAAGPPAAPPANQLRQLLAAQGVVPLATPPPPNANLIELGRLLMFDPVLSGNKNIACATCHHPSYHTTDYLSLSVGQGARFFGPARLGAGPVIPRNALDLYNRALPEWTTLFWDGRVSQVADRVNSPAGNALPSGLSPLGAQAMFPVLDHAEMRGLPGDTTVRGEINELAALNDADPAAIWAALMRRLLAIPEYRARFAAAFPAVDSAHLGFQHAALAMAAFQEAVFVQLDSPFDQYLRGDDAALDSAAIKGALLFYGKARCSACHSGPLLSDQRFHNIAVPQLGPGMIPGEPLDEGRFRVTGDPRDRFAFRTPPLRNVALTGPWMHDGAYATLTAAVRHYRNPVAALAQYDPAQLLPAFQAEFHGDAGTLTEIVRTVDTTVARGVALTDDDVQHLVAFLVALTDPRALNQAREAPARVPSGLSLY